MKAENENATRAGLLWMAQDNRHKGRETAGARHKGGGPRKQTQHATRAGGPSRAETGPPQCGWQQRGLVKGGRQGGTPQNPQARPFTPGKHQVSHFPDLQIKGGGFQALPVPTQGQTDGFDN